MDVVNNEILNVGGGAGISVSLQEMTAFCREMTGNTVPIQSVAETRPADIRIYVTDNSKVTKLTGWEPTLDVRAILADTFDWMKAHEAQLKRILN